MADRDEWIRVESESDLAPGMVVQVRPCQGCRRIETEVLFRHNRTGPPCSICGTCAGWFNSGCQADRPFGSCLRESISEGRLFRLANLPVESSDAEVASRPREMERAR